MLSRLFKLLGRTSSGSQRGIIMLEALAAIAVTATAGSASLMLISVAANSSTNATAESTASWLASSQAEKIQAAIYVFTPGVYPGINMPTGFTVSNSTANILGGDSAIQLVTVAVAKDGSEILSVEFVKVDR